jgi:hypothetical protein
MVAILVGLAHPFAIAEDGALNDPTRPLGALATATGSGLSIVPLILQAIFVRDGSSSAIINGISLRVGDSAFGYTLKEIGPQAVLLENRADEQWLQLRGTPVIKKAPREVLFQ